MNQINSHLDLFQVLKAIGTITKWAKDGTGTLMYQSQSAGVPKDAHPAILEAVQEISEIRGLPPLHLMINKIPPGIHVPKHRDWLKPTQQGEHPTLERWHLPIQANDQCGWWDEVNGDVIMQSGFWWGPMPYWKYHSVFNSWQFERIHLIVDLDTPQRLGSYGA